MAAEGPGERKEQPKLTEEERKEPGLTEDELFESLIIEAQFVPGDHGISSDIEEIPWLDMDLAQSGQDFFQDHYTSILFAHVLYFGIFWGLKPISGIVWRTGKFSTLDRVTKRNLSTLWHVLSWYEQDLIGTYSNGAKTIANIRKTHEMMRRKCGRQRMEGVLDDEEPAELTVPDPIGRALEKDLQFVEMSTFERMDMTYDPPEPISQFAMSWQQFSFVIPLIVHPLAFGIHDLEGFEGFEHLWALIGRLSGVDDRYNIPLLKPGKSFYIRFSKEVLLPSLLIRGSKIIQIQQSFFRGSNSYIPSLSIPGSLYLFLKKSQMEGFTGKEIYKKGINLITKSMMNKVLTKFSKEEEGEGRQFTYLPHDTKWSAKYRKRDARILHKWKFANNKLAIMQAKRPTFKAKKHGNTK